MKLNKKNDYSTVLVNLGTQLLLGFFFFEIFYNLSIYFENQMRYYFR